MRFLGAFRAGANALDKRVWDRVYYPLPTDPAGEVGSESSLKTGQVSALRAPDQHPEKIRPRYAGVSFLTESLILAQGERWRRALDMQVER